MLAAAILAAGESRRMGSPKALLPYRGSTFLEHLVSTVQHPRVGIVRIVLGAGADRIRDSLSAPASDIIVNTEWQLGQLSSIQSAVRHLKQLQKEGKNTEGVIVCPVDHPLITADLVAKLIAEFDASGKAIVLPKFKGRRGHPVIFRSILYDELLAASPEVGARQVVWAHAADLAEVPTDEEGTILNLNDPESFRRATGQAKP
jgi:molybdenum cofactor cytidylyltransferase